jgi:hypothetical protein
MPNKAFLKFDARFRDSCRYYSFRTPFGRPADIAGNCRFVVVSLCAQNQEASVHPAGHQEPQKERQEYGITGRSKSPQ